MATEAALSRTSSAVASAAAADTVRHDDARLTDARPPLAGTPSNDDVIQRKSGAWTNRTPAQLKTDLALAKADVGLGSVDNTADSAKPVSSAQQTALDAKLDTSAAAELIRDTIGTALVEGNAIDITVNDGGDTITIAMVPTAVYATPRTSSSVSTATNVDGTVAGDAQYTITANVTFTPTGTPDGRMMLIWVKASGATRVASVAGTVELPTSGGPTSRDLSIPSGDLGVFAVSYTTFAGTWMLMSAEVFDL